MNVNAYGDEGYMIDRRLKWDRHKCEQSNRHHISPLTDSR